MAIRKKLAEEEGNQLRMEGLTMMHPNVSPSVLIVTGLELEEQQ
jgi:hypothetical protein